MPILTLWLSCCFSSWPRSNVRAWASSEVFFGNCKYPIYQKDSLFSLWPAILTSCSYKSPGLLIITITHLTELLTSFPVGIEREGFFSIIGGTATPNRHIDGGPGSRHRGPFVTSIGPSHFGYLPEHTAPPLLPQNPSRESFTLQRGQPGN